MNEVDPTACAEQSKQDGTAPAFMPCTACGHAMHQHYYCDLCRVEIRLREIETALRVRGA